MRWARCSARFQAVDLRWGSVKVDIGCYRERLHTKSSSEF